MPVNIGEIIGAGLATVDRYHSIGLSPTAVIMER
ncbi:hypothetical protein IWX75_002240 [Arthrobacter sp. CAN_A6]